MASAAILESKQLIIDEVKETVQKASTIVLFDYRGLTDNESKELRKALRETGSDYKIFKNTLMNRAFSDLNIDLTASLEGPSALAYGTDMIAPIKVLSDFAKKYPALTLKIGVVDGTVSDKDVLASLANIPSRDTLLTMLAGGLIGIVRDLSIGLNLYAEKLNDGKPLEQEAPVVEENVETTKEETPATEEVVEASSEVTETAEEPVEEVTEPVTEAETPSEPEVTEEVTEETVAEEATEEVVEQTETVEEATE